MIGVFDSGVGGLSVLKALRAELPHEDFIYIADSGHAPYGERDDTHVIARSQAITAHLVAQNVKALVIACNTATAAAIDLLRAQYPVLPIIGVEPALKPAVALSSTGRIGIMATRGTLASSKFRALVDAQRGQTALVLQPCDGLADAIERNDTASIKALCERYTRAMGSFGGRQDEIDTLVLGCTHYPFAVAQLRDLLGPDVQLVDTGDAVARQTRKRLDAGVSGGAIPSGRVRLFATASPAGLEAAAQRWLGVSAAAELLSF
ncbi:MAG: glutamate racemase [Pseudomonadota bacterium]